MSALKTIATRPRVGPGRETRPELRFGFAPLLAVVAALGLLMVAVGNTAARLDETHAQPLFWGGLIVIYAPIALRLFSVSASREERIALAILLGGSLYVFKVLYEPTSFNLHDELATWRQTSDLISSGRALSDNPIVTGYAGFPGLELFTSALSKLGGLRIFLSGTIVIGLARLALMLGLFLFLERATRSSRAAGIAVALYACNPSFLYFDSQFGYESIALVIAAALLLVAVDWDDPRSLGRRRSPAGLIAAMVILSATLAITHHMTSYAMVGFLGLWALMIAFAGGRQASGTASTVSSARFAFSRAPWLDGPGLPALFLALAAAGWFVFEASHVTTAELGDVLKEAIESVIHLITGESGSKTLFQSAGQTNTPAARVLGVASIVPLLVLIPLGLLRTWRGRGAPNPLWRALSVVALFYPLTMLLRFTQAGTETSQRASEFVFLGLAFLGGLLLSELPWGGDRSRRLRLGLGLSALMTVIFLGGFIVGESPVTRQPGPFLVGGEARAISPQGLAAAQFAASKLPPGSRVLVDRPNSTLISSYGYLDRVSGSIEGISVTRVFTSKRFDAIDQRVISNDEIDYIVVDRRLTHEPPAGGYYFESTEPDANTYESPLDVAALRKFNHVRGLSRIFDNGAIAIYDTSGLRSK
ncbi:MAG TPA: hypothetical protein VN758_01525 [Solirubrobacterales bacterium]|nr:hypothetical protein [Solirubrobacterales bacterium]